MKNPEGGELQALSVCRHYCRRKVFVLKRMSVRSRADGTLFWSYRDTIFISPLLAELIGWAKEQAKVEHIPCIADRKHGQRLSHADMIVMGAEDPYKHSLILFEEVQK